MEIFVISHKLQSSSKIWSFRYSHHLILKKFFRVNYFIYFTKLDRKTTVCRAFTWTNRMLSALLSSFVTSLICAELGKYTIHIVDRKDLLRRRHDSRCLDYFNGNARIESPNTNVIWIASFVALFQKDARRGNTWA